jgi:nicotinic acid mononucleotide adenylyltransferase
MTATIENAIWEGRFQPFHVGHLAYVERMLSLAQTVWLWVVANELSSATPGRSPVPTFSAAVDEHHVPSKNVLPFWLRYRAATTCLRKYGERVIVCGGRRLDLQWDLYSTILPPNRVFLTPTRDAFEDLKADAWRALGERVMRVDVQDLPNVSGTQLRECVRRGEDASHLMPPECRHVLQTHGYYERLGDL